MTCQQNTTCATQHNCDQKLIVSIPSQLGTMNHFQSSCTPSLRLLQSKGRAWPPEFSQMIYFEYLDACEHQSVIYI